jgi:phospholipid/cholesterol/gamma-HCH transport system substrate-binding protein
MTKQAQVGVFALLALLLLFGVFYVITDFGTRHSGYKVGIHFNSAAGLPTGALVYFSGVTVGTVDSIELLGDNTVDVIIAVNRDIDIPRSSKFLIQAPLTGSPSLIIVPPPPPQPQPIAVLERRVLPVSDQPHGQDSASIADLLNEGQGEIKRLDAMLTVLQTSEPRLLAKLQTTLDNANEITVTANRNTTQLFAQVKQIADTLQTSVTQASSNIDQLTATLNGTVGRNSHQIDTLLGSLNRTAVALNQSMDSLRDLSTNKQLKGNLLATTQNIADLTLTVADLTKDLRNVTGSPQTQAQLRDTVAELDAATQKANSLLATFGGTSSVYGVDAGATPYPVPSGSALPRGAPLPPVSPAQSPLPASQRREATAAKAKAGLGHIVRNLYAIQLRFSELDKQKITGVNPLLTNDRGPQTDVNLVLLPVGGTNFLVGANDIGAKTSYNFAARERVGQTAYVGAGILYSRFGVLGGYEKGRFGLEGRAYDPRRPTVDVYGNLSVTQFARLFLGQRDITHPERRTVFGIQLQF